ncbi:transcription factor IIIC-gamma subunit [Tieghemostelium lacteum]|uniref:Transcription factor IIIC-gamma subunit n=1 Tax=Tieghemostelium lacteum TaxID=361077 RepID=A0A151Z5D0_TIELA|nr:transcription factor IIIC-gamma subunit [Tieghemostelium lacteum]|eukprot:KYQ89004.1 transcription factor IIIC-gamma subunit [Tieghemostelium lacteum]
MPKKTTNTDDEESVEMDIDDEIDFESEDDFEEDDEDYESENDNEDEEDYSSNSNNNNNSKSKKKEGSKGKSFLKTSGATGEKPPKFDYDDFTNKKRKKGLGQTEKTMKHKKLNSKVMDLISQGNGEYSRGEMDSAFNTFAEVVRLAPHYHTAYTILSNIKETQGDRKSALSFLFYGAQIKGNDNDLWKRCADMSRDLQEFDQSLYCYSKAIKNDPDDLDSIWERSKVYLTQGSYMKAISDLKLLESKRPNDPQVIQEMARIYDRVEQIDEAIELLEKFMVVELENTIADLSYDSINLLLDLYNKSKDYQKTITLYKKIQIKMNNLYEIPIDMVLNGCIAYFAMGNNPEIAEYLFRKILNSDVMQIGDIYFFLAEKLFSFGELRYAVQLYSKLIQNEAYNTPSLWCKIAHCHKSLKSFPQAIEFYQKALEAVPGNVNTIIGLSDAYREMGDTERAVAVLGQSANMSIKNNESEKEIYQTVLSDLESKRNTLRQEDVKIYFRQAMAYVHLSKYNQFLGIATALFHGSSEKLIRSKSQSVGGVKKKRKSVVRRKDGNEYYREMLKHNKNPPFAEILDEEEYFRLALDTVKLYSYFGRSNEACSLLSYIQRNVKFTNHLNSHQLKYLFVGMACEAENYMLAFKSVKYVCRLKPYSNMIWNLFNRIISNYGGSSYPSQNRFLTVLALEFPRSIPISIIIGNSNRISGNSNAALYEYFRAFKYQPDEPLIHLLVGTLILSNVMNRRIANRHKLAITAFAFIYKYKSLRINEHQEINYNLARAFHQLGIYYLAVHHYQLVLADTTDTNDQFSLKKESAFNLSLIYKLNGNINAANDLINKYLVI